MFDPTVSKLGDPSGLRRAVGQIIGRGVEQTLDLLYPPRCPVTDDAVTAHGAFSPAAWSRARFISDPLCQACGLPFEVSAPAAPLCGPCAATNDFNGKLTGPRQLDRVRSALAYDEASARLVMAFKYGDRLDQVPAMARLLAIAGEVFFDRAVTLVPVPLHPSRLAHRRFNQAALLSSQLARLTGSDHAPLLLRRTKATAKQKGMSADARRRNVAGAFAIRAGQSAEGLNIVLIDDVLTTGATLLGCARTLRRGGAARVDALTLTRILKA